MKNSSHQNAKLFYGLFFASEDKKCYLVNLINYTEFNARKETT